jgi:hypothetical protein
MLDDVTPDQNTCSAADNHKVPDIMRHLHCVLNQVQNRTENADDRAALDRNYLNPVQSYIGMTEKICQRVTTDLYRLGEV